MLNGMTVVELSQGVSGPYASLLLAEVGAKVVKVESLRGDYTRRFNPPSAGGSSSVFAALNRNKLSIALNGAAPEASEILGHLMEKADVTLRDAPPPDGTVTDYEALRLRNAALVECLISAFGEEGPNKDRPATELVLQAMSGFTHLLGRLGEEPQRYGPDVAQTCTGIMAFNGILAALLHRMVTGEGLRVSISMYGTLLHLQGLLWSAMTRPDEWYGAHCEAYTKPPEHGYKTKDGHLYFNLHRGDEEQFFQLLIELGLEEMAADPRFDVGGREAVGVGRYAHQLKEVWERAFEDKTTEKVVDILSRYGAAAAPVNDYSMLETHPQVQELGIIQTIENMDGHPHKILRAPWTVAGHEQPEPTLAPELGQHSEEVLTTLLDYTPEHVQRLREKKVIG